VDVNRWPTYQMA